MGEDYKEQLDDFKRKMEKHRTKIRDHAQEAQEQIEKSEQRQQMSESQPDSGLITSRSDQPPELSGHLGADASPVADTRLPEDPAAGIPGRSASLEQPPPV